METRSLIVLALSIASVQPYSDSEALSPLEQVLKSRSDAYGTYANEFTQEYEPVAYAAIPLHQPMPVIAILSENPLAYSGQYASSVKQDTYTKPDYHNHIPTEYQFNKHVTEHQKPYSTSEYQKPYADHQKPFAEYQKQYAEYQKPYAEYQKPYAEYQKPYAEYQKPFGEYQKPHAPEYPKYAPTEYVKPYPEFAKPYAPVEYVKPYSPIEYRPHDYVKPYSSVEAPTILYARPSETGGYTYRRRPQKKRSVKRPRKPNPMIIRVHKYRVIRSRRSGY